MGRSRKKSKEYRQAHPSPSHLPELKKARLAEHWERKAMLATLSRASPSAASSSAARHVKKYLLVAPDSTDAGALQRRLDVRARHLEGATASFKGGLVAAGGALLSADELPADPSQPLPFAGSMLIITAPTMAAARDLVESDIYFTSNVWDKEQLQIWPFAEVNFPQVVASTAEALQSEEHS